jgi:SAM-dependent methyltransferase
MDDIISLIKDKTIIKQLVNNYVEEFWFAPQDALLRCTEALIWAKRHFQPPVLDIGTGNGSNSKHIYSMNQIIDVGIDADIGGVKLARKTGCYRKVLTMDASKMTFKSGSFGTVLSNSTFEHILDDVGAIREVSRVLRIKGMFYLTLPIQSHVRILRTIGVSEKEINEYDKRVQHLRYRRIIEWKRILLYEKLKVIYYKSYFPADVVKTWYKFHKISTFRPYRRELWSYLKDSSYSKLFPSFLVKPILKKIIYTKTKKALSGTGGMLFIIAIRVK